MLLFIYSQYELVTLRVLSLSCSLTTAPFFIKVLISATSSIVIGTLGIKLGSAFAGFFNIFHIGSPSALPILDIVSSYISAIFALYHIEYSFSASVIWRPSGVLLSLIKESISVRAYHPVLPGVSIYSHIKLYISLYLTKKLLKLSAIHLSDLLPKPFLSKYSSATLIRRSLCSLLALSNSSCALFCAGSTIFLINVCTILLVTAVLLPSHLLINPISDSPVIEKSRESPGFFSNIKIFLVRSTISSSLCLFLGYEVVNACSLLVYIAILSELDFPSISASNFISISMPT